jgi:hypothetical protein
VFCEVKNTFKTDRTFAGIYNES